jgi:FkbM family methyltransferase
MVNFCRPSSHSTQRLWQGVVATKADPSNVFCRDLYDNYKLANYLTTNSSGVYMRSPTQPVSIIKKVLRKKGFYFFRNSVPRGFDTFSDLRKARLLGLVKTFIDVGANRGEYAELALEYLANLEHVILIEPEQANFEYLVRHFGDKAQVVNCAISNRSGDGILGLSSSDKMHALLPMATNCELHAEMHQSVRVRTLKEIVCEFYLPSPFFIKTDTEGHDIKVIEGLADLFEGTLGIVVEGAFRRGDNITFFQDVYDLLTDRGMLFWGIYDQSPWGEMGSCNVVNGMFLNPNYLRT